MTLFSTLREDLDNARSHDPAGRGDFENALVYSGLHAIWSHRLAHRRHELLELLGVFVVVAEAALRHALDQAPGGMVGITAIDAAQLFREAMSEVRNGR